MHKRELKAINQKSFYGKAVILYEDNGTICLQSYSTIVARIEGGKLVRMWAGWSNTTAKHLRAFCLMHGLKPLNKKEWLAMECEQEKQTYQIAMNNGFTTFKGSALLTEEEAEKEAERIEAKNSRLCVWYE